MTDDFKLRDQANRAARAKTILEDDLVKEAFEKIESGLLDVFKASAIDDDRSRRDTRIALGLLQNLREKLQQVMATGEFAAKELLRIEKESKLRRVIRGRPRSA